LRLVVNKLPLNLRLVFISSKMGKKGQSQKKHPGKSKAGAAKGQHRVGAVYLTKSNLNSGSTAKTEKHQSKALKQGPSKVDSSAKKQRDAEFEALRLRTLGANATKQRAQERKAQGATVLNFQPPSFPLGFQQPSPAAISAPPPAMKSSLDSMLQEITDDRTEQPLEANPESASFGQFETTSSEAHPMGTAHQKVRDETEWPQRERRGNAFAALAEPDAPQWNFAPPSFALNPTVLAQQPDASASLKPHAAFHSHFQKSTAPEEAPNISTSTPAARDAASLPGAPLAATGNQTSFRQEVKPNDYDSDGSL